MSDYLAPGFYAALLWWFATGFILYLNGRAPSSFRWSFGAATAIALLAAWALIRGSSEATVSGAYWAFSCAIAIWGWLEMGFLMGFISGPRRTACSGHYGSWRHLQQAVQVVIYNDVATALVIGTVYLLTAEAPNRLGFWTLSILWVMRISAKLNLYLGVPNLGEAFLPPHLQYLRSFFRHRRMNWLFPVSVTASTAVVGGLVWTLLRARESFQVTSLTLSVSLLSLAVLEHWFMVLPLPSERLWRWALHLGRRTRRGRQTPSTILASETVRSSHKPPHSVRRTSAS